MTYLSGYQRDFLRVHCSEFFHDSPIELLKGVPVASHKVFNICKVRTKGSESPHSTVINSIIESTLGIKGFVERSITVGTELPLNCNLTEYGFLIPLNGWRWCPSVLTEGIDRIPLHLLSSVLADRLSGIGGNLLEHIAEHKGSTIGITGINKFVLINARPYMGRIDTLIAKEHLV